MKTASWFSALPVVTVGVISTIACIGAENLRSVNVINITLENAAVNRLRTDTRKYVRCVIGANEHTPVQARIKLKGNSTFQPIDKKPSFTVTLESDTNTFGGFHTFHLNNCLFDRSCLREYLASCVFTGCGVPAASVSNVRVLLNERDLGIYALVESVDGKFTERRYGQSDAIFYEGHGEDVGTISPKGSAKHKQIGTLAGH